MLYSFDTLRVVEKVPHASEYAVWMSRLSKRDVDDVRAEMEKRMEGKDVNVSSWIPGNDWAGTPFEVIYRKATLFNEGQAAMCFGLMLWELMMERDDWWGCRKCEPGDRGISGTAYFRIEDPTALRKE